MSQAKSSFFSTFYHNKIHPLTNYKTIKNKINKTRQQWTKCFLTNKVKSIKQTKNNKKEKT